MKQWLYKATAGIRYLPFMILFSVAFTLYFNTFDNLWTYDDFPVIVNNPDLRSLLDFKRNLFGYRQLRELSLIIDYQIFGLNPAGYHFQNIFWHALNAFLVFTCAARLGSTKFVAWAAALTFLVHPVHVEVVANISNRKDSLVLAFILFSFLAYTELIESTQRRIVWLSVALILAFMAYHAKENALALLLILLGYELVYLSPNKRFLVRKIWPWLSLFAIAVVVFVGWFFLGEVAKYFSKKVMSGFCE